MSRCIFSLLVLSTISSACLGQDSSTGALRGSVLDPSGRSFAGASIALANDATGVHFEQTSDLRGRFVFELLPPGDYSARVTAEGMSPQLSPSIHVAVGGETEIDFKLTVAGVRESVTVAAEPRSVETDPRGISAIVDERAITNLPLNGRRFTDLSLLTPGATQGVARTQPRTATWHSAAFVAFKPAISSTAATTTMPSLLKHEAVIVRHINFRMKWFRSFEFRQIRFPRNPDGLPARS